MLGNPLPGGRWALLQRDRQETAAGFERMAPGDGRAWLELVAQWDRVGTHLMGALLSPFPPIRHGVPLLARLGTEPGLETARMLLITARQLATERFRGEGQDCCSPATGSTPTSPPRVRDRGSSAGS